MDSHAENIRSLCRLGGGKVRKVSGGRQSTLYPSRDYAVDILCCFGVDVRNDDPDIHPTHFVMYASQP